MLLQGSSLHSFHLTYLEAWRFISFIELLFLLSNKHFIAWNKSYISFSFLTLLTKDQVFWHQFVSKFAKRSSILTPICQSPSILTPTKLSKRSSILTSSRHQICQKIKYVDTNFSDSVEWYFKKQSSVDQSSRVRAFFTQKDCSNRCRRNGKDATKFLMDLSRNVTLQRYMYFGGFCSKHMYFRWSWSKYTLVGSEQIYFEWFWSKYTSADFEAILWWRSESLTGGEFDHPTSQSWKI